MNDRFKFRVWNDTAKKYLLMPETHCIPEHGFYLDCMEDEVIEQCTGLKDANDKLVFEGDIISTKNDTVGVVKFGQYGGNDWDGWHFGYNIDWVRYTDIKNRRPTLRKDFWFWVEQREIEIVGNIHENPELLEDIEE